MNDQLRTLLREQHNDLEHVSGAIRTDDQPPIRFIPKILDRKRVSNGMEHIFISDAVAPSGSVDDHTGILYYETPHPGRGPCAG